MCPLHKATFLAEFMKAVRRGMFRRGEALLGKLTQRDPSLRFVARDEHHDQMLVLGLAVRR